MDCDMSNESLLLAIKKMEAVISLVKMVHLVPKGILNPTVTSSYSGSTKVVPSQTGTGLFAIPQL